MSIRAASSATGNPSPPGEESSADSDSGRTVTNGEGNTSVEYPRRWLALPVVLIGMFMSVFDFFVVNVASPSIAHDLKASPASLELIIAGYGFAYAVGLVTGGRLGDTFGRRRMFLGGMAAFLVASAACGLAPGIPALVVARLFQGGAASVMVPQVLSTIRVTFAADERPRAFALLGVAIGLAQVSGQILGGLLLRFDIFGLTWRPIFLLNIPVGIAAFVLGWAWMPETRASVRHLDLVGVGILSAAIALIIMPLVEGRAEKWPMWAFACLIFALPAFALFGAVEGRIRRAGKAPLVDLRLLRVGAFRAGLAINLAFFASLASFFLTLSLFLQGTGRSPLVAGLTFTPIAVGFFIASLAGPRAVARWGRSPLSFGALILFGALGGLGFLVHHVGATASAPQLCPLLFVLGLGQGLLLTPLVNAVLAGVPPDQAGSASGVLVMDQQLAGAVGVAAVGVVFFGVLGGHRGSAAYAHAFTGSLACDAALVLLTLGLTFLLPSGRAAAPSESTGAVHEGHSLSTEPRGSRGLALGCVCASGRGAATH